MKVGRIIEVGRDDPVLHQTFRLRASVWIGLGASKEHFPNSVWKDEHDSRCCRHWIALDQNRRVIAAARFCLHESVKDFPEPHLFQDAPQALPAPVGLLSRLIVQPEYRGRGLANEFDRVRIQAAKSDGCASLLVCVSSWSGPSRLSSLQNLGFKPLPMMQNIPDWDDVIDVVYLDLREQHEFRSTVR